MKQILSLIANVLLFTVVTQAQITTKSSFLIGGAMSFNTSSSTIDVTQDGILTTAEGPTTSVFSFEPVAAYFVMPNLAIGGQVSYIREKISNDEQTDEVENLLLGPIVRYYVPFLDDKAALFLELDAAFGSSSDKITEANINTSTKNSVSKLGVGPGLTVFVNNLIGLEAIAKYNYIADNATVETPTISYSSASRSNEFDFQIGLQFYFTR